MIARNDWMHRDRLDALSRLEDLILRNTNSEVWNATVLTAANDLAKQWAELRGSSRSDRLPVLVRIYRLSCVARAFQAPKEYFFWLLAGWLHVEAHVGRQALFHQKKCLGSLWERLEAIRRKHRWPKKDGKGDPWDPEEHLDQVPEDYAAWSAEFERVADEMERTALRAVCDKYGVPEIARLKEADPNEFDRRCDTGREYARCRRPGD